GGCYVETCDPLAEDTPVELVLRAAQVKLIICGRVSNSRPGAGMGIQFAATTEEERQQVLDLIPCALAVAKYPEEPRSYCGICTFVLLENRLSWYLALTAVVT